MTKKKVQTGYLYHISSDFLKLVDDPNLQINHMGNRSRPSYFVIKDNDILWFIPLSSKVDKYKKEYDKKIKKYGKCNTILIRNIANKPSAILIQNAFPTIEKYLAHSHTVNGIPYRVPTGIQKEIEANFYEVMHLKKEGINLFFTDIDKIKEIITKELKNSKTDF